MWQQAAPVIEGVEDAKDAQKDGEGDEEDSGGDEAEQKAPRRKRRKKYDWDESDWGARAEEEKRLAQEVRKWFKIFISSYHTCWYGCCRAYYYG